jgi:hypothetical protein
MRQRNEGRKINEKNELHIIAKGQIEIKRATHQNPPSHFFIISSVPGLLVGWIDGKVMMAKLGILQILCEQYRRRTEGPSFPVSPKITQTRCYR